MNRNPEIEIARPSCAREEGVASVILLVGGTFQCVTHYTDPAPADVVVYADVQSEGALPRDFKQTEQTSGPHWRLQP